MTSAVHNMIPYNDVEGIRLDYSFFFRTIHQNILHDKRAYKKHIIRFSNPLMYQACIQHMKKLKKSYQMLSFVQPIGMIHALCCSLKSSSCLHKFKSLLTIEEDVRMKLHHYPHMYPSYSSPSRESWDSREYPASRELRQSHSRTHTIPWGVSQIKAPRAWKKSKGKHVKIAVIDTGVDFTHPDLRPALAGGINLVNRHLPPDDDNGHGTHIAGTIAATNARNGIIGVAPKAKIYAIKAFDADGSAYVSDIIHAIEWCVRNQIRVINMSFGMKNSSVSLREAVRNAYNAGVIITASSGNDGKTSGIDYPARYPQTIAVGASDKKGRIASFSNRGKGITIYAPGEKIHSTWPDHEYKELSGTSMATSHVSGVIGLMLALKPQLTPDQIRKQLLSSATYLKTSGHKAEKAVEVNAIRAIKPSVDSNTGKAKCASKLRRTKSAQAKVARQRKRAIGEQAMVTRKRKRISRKTLMAQKRKRSNKTK